MRKVRDVLRLSANGLSKRKIAASLGLSATAVGDCIRRAWVVGVAWPLAPELTDAALERLLYPPAAVAKQRPQPDWAAIHLELKRPGVTLQLLWEEYRAVHPDAHAYSRFCEIYHDWRSRLSPTMRQTHVAGGRLMVDYAGKTLEVIDGATGEAHGAQLFVAVLASSNYTFKRTGGNPLFMTSIAHLARQDARARTPATIVSIPDDVRRFIERQARAAGRAVRVQRTGSAKPGRPALRRTAQPCISSRAVRMEGRKDGAGVHPQG
jgi:hypothetical protein